MQIIYTDNTFKNEDGTREIRGPRKGSLWERKSYLTLVVEVSMERSPEGDDVTSAADETLQFDYVTLRGEERNAPSFL